MDEERKPVVLVAVEPRAYRGAIGPMLAMLRPGLDVRVVEPEEVQKEAARLHPGVVISGLAPPWPVERNGTSWVRIVFPVGPGTWVAVGDDPLVDRPGFGVEELLELVDGILEPNRPPPPLSGSPSRRWGTPSR